MREILREQVVARYMDLLEGADDPELRDRLRERLIADEAGFGQGRERLEMADRFIARLGLRLREQEARIADLAREGADTRPAERLRQTVAETLRTFHAYRRQLQRALDLGEA